VSADGTPPHDEFKKAKKSAAPGAQARLKLHRGRNPVVTKKKPTKRAVSSSASYITRRAGLRKRNSMR
jgi:hypothetical protein